MPCPYIRPHKMARKIKKEILEELQQPGINITTTDLENILSRVGTDSKIESHLESLSNNHYSKDTRRWTSIPQDPVCELLLYEPVTNLLNDILSHYGKYDSSGRKFLNAFDLQAAHEGVCWPDMITKRFPAVRSVIMDEKYFHSIGDIGKSGLSRRRCASPIEVRLDDDDFGDDCLAQCGIYAEEIFVNQVGRRFVYIPLITEHRLRLYRFDRGGVLISPWIDYHQRPNVLIRIALLTCGQSGDLIGANPAIIWEGPDEFITVDGSTYRINEDMASNTRIIGRGTCIWGVENAEGQPCVIKYMWRDAPQPGRRKMKPEWELLGKLKGLEGVVQLIGHSPEYSLFEDRNFKPEHPFQIQDRLASFVVVERYGKNITQFSSPLHLLHILRDAIAGHRNMWRRGVIHRDVSFNNILQGGADAQEGFHGVLIDMDMAIYASYWKEIPKCSWLYGTPAFQSCKVMSTQMLDPPMASVPRHTYMEDLESFMWVFLCITAGYEALTGGGSREIDPPQMELRKVIASDPEVACANKLRILKSPCSSFPLHPSYPPQFDTLKTQLMRFFRFYSLQKPQKFKFPITLESLAVYSECHYNEIIGYINSTIMDMEKGVVRSDEDIYIDFDDQDWDITRKAWAEEEVYASDDDPGYFHSDESASEPDLDSHSTHPISPQTYNYAGSTLPYSDDYIHALYKTLPSATTRESRAKFPIISNTGMDPDTLAKWVEQTPVARKNDPAGHVVEEGQPSDPVVSPSKPTSGSVSKRPREHDGDALEHMLKRARREPNL